jgi:hypothetical protein
MAKKARRIRYVARRKGKKRRHKKNPPGLMGLPLWLIGGGVVAFLIYRKVQKDKEVSKAAQVQAAKVAQVAAPTADDELEYELGGVGGSLASGGLGSLS